MPFIDFVVMACVLIGTSAASVLLWRRGLRGRRLLAAAWLAFYGVVLTVMMTAHSVDVLYATTHGGGSGDGTPRAYDFRTYALHLLGGVLVWQGIRVLRSVAAMGRMRREDRSRPAEAAVVTLCVVVPLIPIHAVFAVPFAVLSALTLVVLATQRGEHAAVPA